MTRTTITAGAVIAALAVGLAVAIVFAVRDSNAWEARCKAAGGHVVTSTSTGVGVSGSGKPVVTTSSTSFCLSADGRILEV